MRIRSLFLLLSTILVFSCDQKPLSEIEFIAEYELQHLPKLDSTNFENHQPGKSLTKKEIELLKLDRIFENNILHDSSALGISYRLDLSNNFQTIVVYAYITDHELISILINYDNNFNIIDYKQIAMDEIAESMLSTQSVIDKTGISVTNFRFFDTGTQSETVNYSITEEGKINKKDLSLEDRT